MERVNRTKVSERTSFKLSTKLWRKLTKAQGPITIYWGTTKFQKETKVNFYSNIVNYTVNMILGFDATSIT